MGNACFAPDSIALALNIATAAIVLSVVGLLVAKAPRSIGLPLQHGLLCMIVILTLLSPVPLWLSHRCGLGLLTLSSANGERYPINQDFLERPSGLDPKRLSPNPTSPNQTTGNDTFVNTSKADRNRLSSELPSSQMEVYRNTVGVSVFQIAGSLLILLWGIIASGFTIRLIRGLVIVRRIQQSLKLSVDPRINALGEQAFRAAGVDSRAEIFESRLVPTPLTLGWCRPSVVMPHGLADVLDDKQLESILAHEVAHMVRRDTTIALIQQIAAALFWWNPLLRTVNHQISQMRERLCDDCVVMRYGDGMPLAESIIQVAQWSATRTLSSPLSLALLDDFSDLENRIHCLTDESRMRLIQMSTNSTIVLSACSVLLGATLLLPIVRAQDVEPKPNTKAKTEVRSKSESPSINQQRKPDTPNFDQATTPKETTPSIPFNVSGSVLTEDGNPVSQATVYLVSTNGIDAPIGQTKTDHDGHYQFRDVLLPTKKPQEDEVASGTFQVFGEADGFGIAWHGMRHFTNAPRPENYPRFAEDHSCYLGEPIEMALTMRKETTLTGRITDENGIPVPHAKIELSSLDYLDTEGHELHPNFREFWAMFAAPEKYRKALTNDDGRFEIKGLPDESVAVARIYHADFADQMFWVAFTDRSISEYRFIQNSAQSVVNDQQVSSPIWATRSVMTSPLDIRVAATRRVVIHIIQGEDSLPVQNVKVSAQSRKDSLLTGAYGKTDKQGRVELKLPPGVYQLVADPPRETDFVRTIDELIVVAEKEEQSIEVQMLNGCVLILEAVNENSGMGIPNVNFWEEFGDGPQKGHRYGVQSSTVWVDNPVTNEKGELRAVVRPGTRRYGVGFSPLPDGYKNYTEQLIECEAGKTIRVQFKLTK